jgi:hypothetical protein
LEAFLRSLGERAHDDALYRRRNGGFTRALAQRLGGGVDLHTEDLEARTGFEWSTTG